MRFGKFLGASFAALAVVCLCGLSAQAVTETEYDALMQQKLSEVGAQELFDEVGEPGGEVLTALGITEPDADQLLDFAPDSLRKVILSLTGKILPEPAATGCALCGILLAAFLLSSFSVEGKPPGSVTAFSVFSVAAAAGVVITRLVVLVEDTADAIGNTVVFMKGFFPVFGAAAAAAGQPTGATVSSAVLLGLNDLFATAVSGLLIPLCAMFLSFGVVSGVAVNFNVSGLSRLFRNVLFGLLSALVTVFTAILSIKNYIAAAGDSLALRSVKALVSGAVPVVGGGLSEASAVILTCLGVVKTTVGVFGILALLAAFLPVFIRLLAWKIMIGLVLGFSELTQQTGISGFLRCIGDTLSVLMAVAACTTFAFIIGISVVLSTAVV